MVPEVARHSRCRVAIWYQKLLGIQDGELQHGTRSCSAFKMWSCTMVPKSARFLSNQISPWYQKVLIFSRPSPQPDRWLIKTSQERRSGQITHFRDNSLNKRTPATSVGSAVAQRLRRWATADQTLGQCVFPSPRLPHFTNYPSPDRGCLEDFFEVTAHRQPRLPPLIHVQE